MFWQLKIGLQTLNCLYVSLVGKEVSPVNANNFLQASENNIMQYKGSVKFSFLRLQFQMNKTKKEG